MQIRGLLEKRERILLSSAALVTLIIWIWAVWPKPPTMTVAFLSVGQGDCEVITTPSGHTVLVDAGPCENAHGGFDAGTKVVVPYLRHQGVNGIDAFIISHPHEDHIGGAAAVFDSYRVQTVLDSGLGRPAGVYAQLLGRLRDRRISYRRVKGGNVIDLHDGVKIEVLSPPPGQSAAEGDSDLNNCSVVVRVTYGKVRVLLSGDAERTEEDEMLSSGEDISADVLKVPHHGSAHASAQEWLAAVHPKVAVISVGWHNPFGHPSQSTLDRLKEDGIDTYRTDLNGTVTLTTDGQRVNIETAK